MTPRGQDEGVIRSWPRLCRRRFLFFWTGRCCVGAVTLASWRRRPCLDLFWRGRPSRGRDPAAPTWSNEWSQPSVSCRGRTVVCFYASSLLPDTSGRLNSPVLVIQFTRIILLHFHFHVFFLGQFCCLTLLALLTVCMTGSSRYQTIILPENFTRFCL